MEEKAFHCLNRTRECKMKSLSSPCHSCAL